MDFSAPIHRSIWPLLFAAAIASLGGSCVHAADKSLLTDSDLSLGGPVKSEVLPAVPNINGWIGAAGDYLHNERGNGAGAIVEGGIAVPFAQDIAGQLHALDGAAGGANLQSIDAYLFWRNPAKGLIGPHVMYTQSGTYHNYLYGLHGEAYLSNWTLTGEGGGVTTRDNNTYYLEALVNWYPVPNWRTYAGAIVLNGDAGGQVGVEYQPGLKSMPGLSIFADAGAGAHDLRYGFIGLRYYFGDPCDPCKSLVRRQREDMVPGTLNLFAIHKKKPPVYAEI